MGKKLGQHFLRDRMVLESIVAAAAPLDGESLLEVGPGEGVLTERLLEGGARVTAVELDPRLAAALRERFGGRPGFRLVEGDIRKVSLEPHSLFDAPDPYKVAANLPYYLSTPLLFRMAAARRHLTRLVLMVQEEVALRMAASPREGKTYGSLSVAMQHAFTVRTVCRVPPSAFRPPPRVHSAVVALEPRPSELLPEEELAFYNHVKDLFTRRRKRMASAFKETVAALPPASRARIDELVGGKRAENLAPAEHLEAFRCLYPPPEH